MPKKNNDTDKKKTEGGRFIRPYKYLRRKGGGEGGPVEGERQKSTKESHNLKR